MREELLAEWEPEPLGKLLEEWPINTKFSPSSFPSSVFSSFYYDLLLLTFILLPYVYPFYS